MTHAPEMMTAQRVDHYTKQVDGMGDPVSDLLTEAAAASKGIQETIAARAEYERLRNRVIRELHFTHKMRPGVISRALIDAAGGETFGHTVSNVRSVIDRRERD